ncbi:sprT domain-containing protein [Clostridium botulinum]|uniref:SprT domain-containing protein n=1 Tax=Clostridium botulinum TaxID=1491 RepID=A0A126JI14_CLOBO|nr:SprT-like domain-containing protein [Clostridium botulinum]ALT05326.1 zinc metallopeptidase SprT family protein [Clostridium botulinum]MBN1050340.1 sprT domain-containing protein [Clostridium botulinum]NFH90524.1 sprT domain-containing protein [Clostridium botulinum]NFI19532.1 sprT domain-containing protein [Clostridium botulinum]NFN06144.1 sprT domain-containing protein [Clostridium botulinum]
MVIDLKKKLDADFNYEPFNLNDIRNRVNLDACYTYYNHIYFNDTLTPCDFIELRWNHLLGESAGMFIKSYNKIVIELNPIYLNLYPEEFSSIFVHEMIHLISIKHDQKFLDEIARIRKLGLEITVCCKHNIKIMNKSVIF